MTPCIFHDNNPFKNKHIHLGVCGSVAAFRAPDLLRWWRHNDIHVSVTVTEGGARFITPLTFEALGATPVYTDIWEKQNIFGHLEPGQKAKSALVIAPASANTLAQLAGGHASSLLSCQALAFDGPLILAPAMNPRMWHNGATQENMARLQARGAHVIAPDVGGTACGDMGQGRLAPLEDIFFAAMRALAVQDMQGVRVLLTLGPTRERWDAVRFWTNPSTGAMGAALATAAWLRGAEVHAVCGPVAAAHCHMPKGVHRYDVTSAKDMFAAAHELWPTMDMGMFTAAVADFSPVPFASKEHDTKFKKDAADADKGLTVHFTPTKDILRTLAEKSHSKQKHAQKILGFAAESTTDMVAAVRVKLAKKGADIIAGNNILQPDSGFGSPTNAMTVADKHGRLEEWPVLSKSDVAWRLCSWLVSL